MLVPVLASHIKRGTVGNPISCAFALALKAVVKKGVQVQVEDNKAIFWLGNVWDDDSLCEGVPLSKAIITFIKKFDGDPNKGIKPKQVKPSKFRINIPKEFLK